MMYCVFRSHFYLPLSLPPPPPQSIGKVKINGITEMCFCLSIYLHFCIHKSQNIEDQILSLPKPTCFQQPFAFTSAGGGFSAFPGQCNYLLLFYCTVKQTDITSAVIKASSPDKSCFELLFTFNVGC